MRLFLATFLLLCATIPAFSFDWTIKGLAAGWNNTNIEDFQKTQFGVRYIPEVSLAQNLKANSLLDAELSLNAFSSYNIEDQAGNTDISFYRAWLRYSTAQFEARLGLQQIKFGPAMILRPLMWFDQLDPRDPLQFSKSVAGGLCRYYFLNNTNIWIWGLVSNGERKGLEIIPSVKNSFEFGGRVQIPVSLGELAVTYFNRRADPNPLLPEWLTLTLDPVPENRFALDGKWDVGLGLWFESAVVQKDIPYYPMNYQKFLTIGADYTFGLGNGLHLLGEHFMMNTSRELRYLDERTELTAILTDYNISLWDMVMGIFFYNWQTNESFQFLTWRRTCNNWSCNVAFYWNPNRPVLAGLTESSVSSLGAGKGFQLMIIFNH